MMDSELKEKELHVLIDHTVDNAETVSLSYYYEGQLHEMHRPIQDPIEKSLRRMLKTMEKAHKSKKKTKRHKHRSNDPLNAQTTAEDNAEDKFSLFFQQQEISLENLLTTDFRTGMELCIGDLAYSVVVNPPTITQLSTFPRAHYTVGYPIVPVVDFDYSTHYLCQWMHEIVPQSGQYELVCSDTVFTPAELSIGRRIKLLCTPYRDETNSEGTLQRMHGRTVVFYLSNDVKPIARYPVPRLVQLREEFYQSRAVPSKPSNCTLRVMTYNILSEGYAQKEQSASTLYWYCSPAYLELEFRGQMIAAELLASNADVIGLQECDRKLFDNYLLPLMGLAGFDGHYTNKVAMVQEGCALFTRRERLTMVDFIDIPYKHVLQRGRSAAATALYEVRPDLEDILGGKLGTVAQIAVVKVQHSKEVLLVANTHLFYHPLASYLRMLQTHALTSCLEDLARDVKAYFDHHPHLLTDRDSSAAYLQPRRLSSYFQEPIDPHFLREELRLMRVLVSLTAHGRDGEEEGRSGREQSICNDFEVVRHPEEEFEEILVEEVRDLQMGGSGVRVSVLIMGDLNSSPRSATFDFLSHGRAEDHLVAKEWAELQQFRWGSSALETADALQASERLMQRQNAALAASACSDCGPQACASLRHDLRLTSAAAELPADVVSNFTPDFRELLDHIFVQSSRHRVMRVAPMPGEAVLQEETALPSSCFPSDHVSVVVDLEIVR